MDTVYDWQDCPEYATPDEKADARAREYAYALANRLAALAKAARP